MVRLAENGMQTLFHLSKTPPLAVDQQWRSNIVACCCDRQCFELHMSDSNLPCLLGLETA
jgi:hypothetical protein